MVWKVLKPVAVKHRIGIQFPAKNYTNGMRRLAKEKATIFQILQNYEEK